MLENQKGENEVWSTRGDRSDMVKGRGEERRLGDITAAADASFVQPGICSAARKRSGRRNQG